MTGLFFCQDHVLPAACICRVGAAFCKAASLFGIDGRGELAFHGDPVHRNLRIWNRNSRKQSLRIRVHRLFKQLVGRCFFYHLAQIHDQNIVGNILDNGEVVRNEQIGQS